MSYNINEQFYKIKDLPVNSQPREKLKNFGVESLNNHELLAIILNNGSKSEDILTLSKRIINDYGKIELVNYKDVSKIQKNFNLSFVKACQIISILEIGKRLFGKDIQNDIILNNPLKVYEHVKDMYKSKKEIFHGLYVNIKNRLIYEEIITIGNTTENIIDPQLIFSPAITYYAQGIIIVHNHPSNDKSPSMEDIHTTKNLIKAGNILKIPIIDHIIIVKNDYFSFNENKMM